MESLRNLTVWSWVANSSDYKKSKKENKIDYDKKKFKKIGCDKKKIKLTKSGWLIKKYDLMS